MLNCYKLLLLYLFLLAALPAISQSTPANDRLLANYNNYLKIVKLDQLLRASNFSFQDKVVQPGKSGDVILVQRKVLTLEPAIAFADPLEFAGAWNKTAKTLSNRINIYQLLLLTLADYSQSPVDSLVVQLKTAPSNIFSFMVYFNGGIQVVEPLIGVKGNSTAIHIDPSDFENSASGGTISDIPVTPNLDQKIMSLMTVFFKPAIPRQRQIITGVIYCEAAFNHGPVTHNRELITVNLTLLQSTRPGFKNLTFTFHVAYAGGMDATDINPRNYFDATHRYYEETSRFGAKLKAHLSQLAPK